MTQLDTVPTYLEPSQEGGAALLSRQLEGDIVMLNLLKFREVADYSPFPELAPEKPLSGSAAYERYIQHTLPHLRASGGELLFLGRGGHFLIGPPQERWDAAMLVRQASAQRFMAFARNEAYLRGVGHRTAALEDSRVLPLVPQTLPATQDNGC